MSSLDSPTVPRYLKRAIRYYELTEQIKKDQLNVDTRSNSEGIESKEGNVVEKDVSNYMEAFDLNPNTEK